MVAGDGVVMELTWYAKQSNPNSLRTEKRLLFCQSEAETLHLVSEKLAQGARNLRARDFVARERSYRLSIFDCGLDRGLGYNSNVQASMNMPTQSV